jgi:polar amino acid transport system substrate-binding protein
MNIQRSLLYLMILLFSASSVSWASDGDELIFHVIGAQPFGYVDGNGKNTGLHFEVVEALAKRSGIAIRPVIMPYNRIWETLENGVHDGGIVWRSEERDSLVDYLSFVWTDYITALTLKNKEISNYEDLQSGADIGLMKSSSINNRFNNDNKINKVFIGKYDNALTMLIGNRLDAIVGNLFAYIYVAKVQGGLDKLSLPGFYMGHREQWLQISKKSRNLLALSESDRKIVLAKLTKAMQEMVSDGTIREINRKYYGDAVNLVNDMLAAKKVEPATD